MTKKQFLLLFSSLFVLTLIFTNPSELNHIETVKSKLKIAFKKKMASEMIDENSESMESIGNGLGLLLGDTFIDKMTDGFISRNNFFLFSTTIAEYKGEKKTIGFGILGNVFVTDEISSIFNKNEESNTNNDNKEDSKTFKTLKGKIKAELCYGPPNWGEDPKNDQKLNYHFIQLNEPMDFGYLFGEDSDFDNIKIIQLMNVKENYNFEDYIGTEVEISGEIFEWSTGYHKTPILIDVQKIEENGL